MSMSKFREKSSSLIHGALGYQCSLEQVLAGIVFKLFSIQFRSLIKYCFKS